MTRPNVVYGPDVFRIKDGNVLPPIEYVAKDENEKVVPLTGATGVQFVYRKRTAAKVTAITRTATIVDAGAGQLRYDWILADTDGKAGEYYGEWVVTFPFGTRTFPVRLGQYFVIEDDLA